MLEAFPFYKKDLDSNLLLSWPGLLITCIEKNHQVLFAIEIYAWIVVISLFRKMAMVSNITNQIVLPISTHENSFTNDRYMDESPVRPSSYNIWVMNKEKHEKRTQQFFFPFVE